MTAPTEAELIASLSTTAEYGQLILAEAVHAVATAGETQPSFEAAIAEALAEERVDPKVLVSMLAMAAAAQLAIVAQARAVSPYAVLREVIEGWNKGQEQLIPALAALVAAEPAAES